jgi:hypothetical protein
MMKNNKNRMPTDEPLKTQNPKNRDFQRTPEQTDNVSASENEERARERKQSGK